MTKRKYSAEYIRHWTPRKPFTILAFTFERTGKPMGDAVAQCFDDFAARYWTVHYGYVHDDGRIDLGFESQGQLPKHYDLGEVDEFGVAVIHNTTRRHKASAVRAMA